MSFTSTPPELHLASIWHLDVMVAALAKLNTKQLHFNKYTNPILACRILILTQGSTTNGAIVVILIYINNRYYKYLTALLQPNTQHFRPGMLNS